MPDNLLTGLSAKQLLKAATIRKRIDVLTKQLQGILGSKPAKTAKAARKRKMSAAARAKIAAAQRKRWAKQKAAKKAK